MACSMTAAVLPSKAVCCTTACANAPALQGVSVDDIKSKLTAAEGPQTNATQADYVGSCPPLLHASVLPIAGCRDPPMTVLLLQVKFHDDKSTFTVRDAAALLVTPSKQACWYLTLGSTPGLRA